MSSPALVFSREDLLAEHPYARPQEAAGYRLHGGFDADGRYVPPRTLHRWPAVRGWQEALLARGFPLIEATTRLLATGPYPSYEQQKLLLQHGLGQTLWSSLTITGVIEARGRLLIDLPAPDFQSILVEDVSATGTGHLSKGLLLAHGMDEGGDPASALGAHDQMWFAIRDLIFGANAYPLPEIPANIARPEGERLAPAIPTGYEQMLSLLMNVLMIEVRAENAFTFVQRVLADPELFADRRREAELGLELVERIRTDEAIHVAYLQLVLSELRSFTFRSRDGALVPGTEVIDPMWATLVHWHSVENPRLTRETQRQVLRERVLAHPEGERLWRELEARGSVAPGASAH
jgi:hypothetical protein